MAQDLSKKTKAIIAISGEKDIICDEKRSVVIKNGDSMMANITGAGCMLTSLIAAHVASNKDKFNATVTAIAQMGIAGEIAKELLLESEGNSSYRNHLIDTIAFLDTDKIKEKIKYEIF
jgi:hydroxyethylthiazole kinase